MAMRLLRKYDFSYKKYFGSIAVIFVLAILLGGLLLDRSGLNEYLSKGAMRGYYQRLEMRDLNVNHPGRGVKQNGRRTNSK